ncbi:hypothetical protein [Algoriphagus sp.]|uniref:hypothetical protein n=1 Tax=Algoriphagus sp. TaxID=1872435 RepID=UPI003F71D427
MIINEIHGANRRKLDLFEEFLAHLLNWYTEVNSSTYSIEHRQMKNDLSKLKVFKLHFFATSTSEEAIEIFNSFHALPYGHVETDIYSGLEQLRHFRLTNTEMIPLDNYCQEVKGMQGVSFEMINNLRRINPDIINYSAFDLVKLSHKWFSWKHNYSIAKENFSRSKKINSLTILNENKYYKLAF